MGRVQRRAIPIPEVLAILESESESSHLEMLESESSLLKKTGIGIGVGIKGFDGIGIGIETALESPICGRVCHKSYQNLLRTYYIHLEESENVLYMKMISCINTTNPFYSY